MMPSQIVQVAATADITTRDAYLSSVTLSGGSDAAVLTVKAGGSGGTTILVVKAAIATTVAVPDLHDSFCGDGIHATLTGTAPSATFTFS